MREGGGLQTVGFFDGTENPDSGVSEPGSAVCQFVSQLDFFILFDIINQRIDLIVTTSQFQYQTNELLVQEVKFFVYCFVYYFICSFQEAFNDRFRA